MPATAITAECRRRRHASHCSVAAAAVELTVASDLAGGTEHTAAHACPSEPVEVTVSPQAVSVVETSRVPGRDFVRAVGKESARERAALPSRRLVPTPQVMSLAKECSWGMAEFEVEAEFEFDSRAAAGGGGGDDAYGRPIRFAG